MVIGSKTVLLPRGLARAPAIMTRPSARWVWPLQKAGTGITMSVEMPVSGSWTLPMLPSAFQPQSRILPVSGR
jgi:hypothetical protein